MQRPLCLTLLLLSLLLPSAASAQQASWPEDGFSALDYTTTGLATAGALTFTFLDPPYSDPPAWSGGVLFDDGVRDALVLQRHEGRATLATLSDGMVTTLLLYPLLVDGLLVPLTVHKDRAEALQLSLINLQALAFNAFLTQSTKYIAARERPYQRACREGRRPNDPLCDEPIHHVSFFSGHSSFAFTGAGLLCAHHLHRQLYQHPFADRAACFTGLALAATTATFRIMADKHYTSDVLVGTTTGLLMGWLLPVLLHDPGASATDQATTPSLQLLPRQGGASAGMFLQW